jgi:hypothetical protein
VIYANKQAIGDAGVGDVASKKFYDKGWIGPFPLLAEGECNNLLSAARALREKCMPINEMNVKHPGSTFSRLKWFKSLHELHPIFYELASHPSILQVITPLLGTDVLAWGVSAKRVKAGMGHRWHVDVEQKLCHGITVFVGLRNVEHRSTLKVITGSHRISATPQELKLNRDEDVLTYCTQNLNNCSLEFVNPGDGGFFVMHGNLWHGSDNTSPLDRDAIILQYCTPNHKVRIPLNFDEPIEWSDELPGCALVAGADHYSVNRLIIQPA